jgi:tetratricopeptide (TPR) repeat protein
MEEVAFAEIRGSTSRHVCCWSRVSGSIEPWVTRTASAGCSLLAHVFFVSQEDPAKAQALAEQSLAILKELGSMTCIPHPLGLLGQMSLKQGEWTLARTQLEESLAICQEIGARDDAVDQLLALARVAVAQGDLAAAHRRYQECLALQQEMDYWLTLPDCLEGLAAIMVGKGIPLQAVEMWGVAAARREAVGTPMHPVDRADYEQAVAARRELGEEAFAAAWNAGRMMPLEQAIDEALKMWEENGQP